MDTALDILAAFGVGAAAGLAPFVALATVVLLAAVHLGVNPEGSDFNFMDDAVAVVIAVIVIVQSLLADLSGGLRLRIAADRRIHPLVHGLVAIVMGGFAGIVVFETAGLSPPAGAIAAALGAALVAYGGSDFFGRVGERVKRQRDAARHAGGKKADDEPTDGKKQGGKKGADGGAIALAVDLLTIAAVVLALLVPPLGLVLPVLVVLAMFGRRRKQQKKYEGLRSLR